MKSLRLLRMLLAGSCLAGALGSCGGATDDTVSFDSNTNWLKSCDSSDDCGGALSCICGICTQPCGTNPECGLLGQAECRPSESPRCESAPNVDVGGICVLPCDGDNACPVLFSCRAGQCIPPEQSGLISAQMTYGDTCPFISWDDVYQTVERDVLSVDAEARRYQRYVSLANYVVGGDCGAARVAELGQAMSRVLNSLSSTPVPHPPVAVLGAVETYRIDLRDYGWSFEAGGVVRNFTQYDDAWEALVVASPYAVEFEGDNAENVILQTETTVPLMFADALIDAATEPSLYYALLGIPEDLAGLRSKLRVDVLQNRADGTAMRAGYSDGGRDFLAERHPLPARTGLYYWQTSDFGASPALVNDPLGELSGESEVVFALPNGFLAFAIYNVFGARSDVATIFRDTAQEAGVYAVPRSPLSFYAAGFEVTDTVRARVLGNVGAYAPEVQQGVRARYPTAEALSARVVQDAGVYRSALGVAGVTPGDGQSVRRVFDAYDDDVLLRRAAGDLLYPVENLRRDIPNLDPALNGLDDGFGIDRDDWGGLYLESLCITDIGNENRAAAAECAMVGL